jgi:hypothetical protein
VPAQSHQQPSPETTPASPDQETLQTSASHGNAAAAKNLKQEGGSNTADPPQDLAELKRRMGDSSRSANAIRMDAVSLIMRSTEATTALKKDRTLLCQLCRRIGPSGSPSILEYIGLDMGENVKLLVEAGHFNLTTWGILIEGRTGDAVLSVLEDPAAFKAFQALPGDALALLGNLSRDAGNLEYVLSVLPHVATWIQARSGAAKLEELRELVQGTAKAAAERGAHVKAGDLLDTIRALPNGPANDAKVQKQLYRQLLAAQTNAEFRLLFQKRFGQELTERPGSPWTQSAVVQLWQVAQMLPPAHLAATLKIERDDSGPSFAGGKEITLTMADPEHGSTNPHETDDKNPLLGINVFNTTFRHEIGHNVADAGGFDAEGGWMFQLGWKAEAATMELIRSVFLKAMPFQAELSDSEKFELADAFEDCDQTEFSPSELQGGMSAELWAKVQSEPIVKFLIARSSDEGGRWRSAPLPINGRLYHACLAGPDQWYSVPMALYSKRVSDYAMYSPMEYFAEAYATFYADADQPGGQVGGLLKARDPGLEKQFQNKVHGSHALGKETGQGQS